MEYETQKPFPWERTKAEVNWRASLLLDSCVLCASEKELLVLFQKQSKTSFQVKWLSAHLPADASAVYLVG